MKTSSLIAAAAAVTTILGACTSTGPTGLESPVVAPSFDFANTIDDSRSTTSVDTIVAPSRTETCAPAPVNGDGSTANESGTYAVAYSDGAIAADSWQVSATGTYAVAYGDEEPTPSPTPCVPR